MARKWCGLFQVGRPNDIIAPKSAGWRSEPVGCRPLAALTPFRTGRRGRSSAAPESGHGRARRPRPLPAPWTGTRDTQSSRTPIPAAATDRRNHKSLWPFDSSQRSRLSRLCAGTCRGRFLRQAPGPGFDYSGMISGLLFGNFAMVALLTLKCCATIAGGVRVIQSDRETSAKYGALKTSRNCRSVSPVFLI